MVLGDVVDEALVAEDVARCGIVPHIGREPRWWHWAGAIRRVRLRV